MYGRQTARSIKAIYNECSRTKEVPAMKLVKQTKWYTRAKHAAFALLFLSTYTLSMLAPFVSVAHAAGQITFGSQFENQVNPNDPNTWGTGQLSGYSEGDYIQFRYTLTATNQTSAGDMTVTYDKGSCNFFTSYFGDIVVTPPIATVTPGSQTEDSNGYTQTLHVQFNQAGTTTVMFKLRLSNTAGNCSGSNTGVRLGVPHGSAAGDFGNVGGKNLPISAGSVLINPSLTLVKSVVGGTAVASDFYFTVSPAINGISRYDIAPGATSVTIPEVNPDGQFVVTEHGPSGYVMTAGMGTGCVLTSLANGTMTATVVAGRPSPTNATCTFTNTWQTGQLKVIKDVINDNGGTKTYADFHFTVNGGQAQSFDATTSPDGAKTLTLPTGTYTVVEPEANTMGYTTAMSNCSNIVVTANTTTTCTITNNDNAPKLTLNKILIKDNGGTAAESNWTLTANGGAAGTLSGPGAVGNADVVSGPTFKAGTYALSESAGSSGYTASAWSCTGGKTPNANSQITMNLGDDITCTITNDDQPGTLVINKVVINDNGGTSTASSFKYIVNGGTPTSFTETTDPLRGHNELTVNAGKYTVTEDAATGYATSYANCTDVVVPNGGSATCTITNDDVSPYLTLVKLVTNDNGGTAVPADWTLAATGPSSFSGSTGVDSTTVPKFLAGSYTLSETGPSGYAASDWSCTGGTAVKGVIALVLGQSATCTITNNDNAPKLKLVKQVINDNGGTRAPSEWTLSADGPTYMSGPSGVTSGPAFSAGVYQLGETGPTDYKASGWSCVGKDVTAGKITMNLGDDVTCTVVNDDMPPTLTLKKVVSNQYGGTAEATDWTLTASGPTTLSGAGGATSGATFSAGDYTLSESTGPSGYSAEPWVCNGKRLWGSTVRVALGQKVTCVIVNCDTPAYIVGTKFIVNADSSLASDQSAAAGWDIALYQNNDDSWSLVSTTTTDEQGNFSFSGLATGWYKLVETLKSGWTQVFGGTPFYVGLGETVGTSKNEESNNLETTSTDFGNFKNGAVGGYKWNDVNGNGKWDETEDTLSGWTIFVDANGNGKLDDGEMSTVTDENGWYEFNGFGPNQQVQICEVMQAGWHQTFPAEEYNCLHFTFTQSGQVEDGDYVSDFGNQQLASLSVVKDAQPNSSKSFTFVTDAAKALDGSNLSFTLVDNGQLGTGTKTFSDLVPGTYIVTEQADSAWKLSSIVCSGPGVTMTRDGTKLTVVLAAGAVASCTFVNSFIPQVLGDSTVVPVPTLVNTGTPGIIATALVALSLMVTAIGVTLRRRGVVEQW